MDMITDFINNFDASSLIVSLIFSLVGMVYFAYGKNLTNFSFMFFGLLLMSYVYFLESISAEIICGLLLSAGPFIHRKYF